MAQSLEIAEGDGSDHAATLTVLAALRESRDVTPFPYSCLQPVMFRL